MARLEEKARKIVRNAYYDYLDNSEYGVEESKYWYRIYDIKLEMLKELFPKTTNEEQLERTWYAMWKKEYNNGKTW